MVPQSPFLRLTMTTEPSLEEAKNALSNSARNRSGPSQADQTTVKVGNLSNTFFDDEIWSECGCNNRGDILNLTDRDRDQSFIELLCAHRRDKYAIVRKRLETLQVPGELATPKIAVFNLKSSEQGHAHDCSLKKTPASPQPPPHCKLCA
nr:hypothetical protein CFP56_72123 [Quercus suber]